MMGLIETPIIDESIVRFLIQSDIDTRSFGLVFNALGYLAESNQLTIPPNGPIIDNLFYKRKERDDDTMPSAKYAKK